MAGCLLVWLYRKKRNTFEYYNKNKIKKYETKRNDVLPNLMHNVTLRIKISHKKITHFKQTRGIFKCICLGLQKTVSLSFRGKTKGQGVVTLQSRRYIKSWWLSFSGVFISVRAFFNHMDSTRSVNIWNIKVEHLTKIQTSKKLYINFQFFNF